MHVCFCVCIVVVVSYYAFDGYVFCFFYFVVCCVVVAGACCFVFEYVIFIVALFVLGLSWFCW